MRYAERQVGPDLKSIRSDHKARYEWAANRLDAHSRVLDLGAGVGYGTHILSKAGHRVLGLEKDAEACKYWYDHWRTPSGFVTYADLEEPLKESHNDAAVAFEIVEHLRDPKPMLKSIDADRLYVSVPNENVWPWQEDCLGFHYRHYTKDQLRNLLVMCGWKPVRWWHQIDSESRVESLDDVSRNCTEGQTIIAECDKFDPEFHVAVLGLGPSLEEYVNIVKRLGHRRAFSHETWGINAAASVVQCDAVWHMDDYRIQKIRAEAKPDSNIANMLAFLTRYDGPIFTSRAYPELPGAIEYPLEDLMNHYGFDYFNSTAAYAIAYALHIGVTKLSLFGFDFTYPDSHKAEKGRGCVEFWLGQAAARGVKIAMPKTSSLMDALYPQQQRLYGYDTWTIKMDKVGDRISVQKTERDELPTAEQIEADYDHGVHPNPLMN